ncbi:TIR domain-containing protein [Arthrobacter sp. R4]|uniref:TIR domain-containing protein n=1 Tax=Arthrobacter sp. R4 TaxID=644417 RepID=UPI003EDB5E18
MPMEAVRDKRKIFVVHGRDLSLRDELVRFLKYVDTSPISWTEARFKTGRPSPTTLEIVTCGLMMAQAVVVLFSPDDDAKLKDKFLAPHDGPDERELTGQPRQNVLLEAGMALAMAPERTVLVRVGHPRRVSDIDGINWISLGNDYESRRSLVDALSNAGVSVNDRLDLLDTKQSGTFSSNLAVSPETQIWHVGWHNGMGRLLYRGTLPAHSVRVRYRAHGADHPIEVDKLEPGYSVTLAHFLRNGLGEDVGEEIWVSWTDSVGEVRYETVQGKD